ncbi:uncharacterized protein KY384_004559 [Bacidia gigantensis]|uniref:uncharacterized protein n=1 Tax=Bacidia gigantensis TaxID=2732470 RepID=UPI001D03E917|nr:uncharacterized protein KY384_004559 [Bacidia gigantensis]KAG8531201.1 hypothetical protein KY384_004559 [Bacidia gigantensis]
MSAGRPVKKLPEETIVVSSEPTSELYKQIALQSGASVHRLRITKGSDGALVPNDTGMLVQTTGLRQQSTIYVKDLGPQIRWRTVFLVEYLGPILIHPAFYSFFTKNGEGASYTQTLTLILVVTHFLKRELETLFIHRFSASTMPTSNIFKNSAHYWLLSGVNMAFWIYRQSFYGKSGPSPIVTSLGLALFVLGELGNLSTHLTLRGLRSSGGKERGIPQGLGFDWVTCPNYMFEVVAWLGVALVSLNWSTVLFAIVATGQMGVWAKKKEARYRKEFGGTYKRKRYAILPGIW